jgi:hypothetical protein
MYLHPIASCLPVIDNIRELFTRRHQLLGFFFLILDALFALLDVKGSACLL